MCYLPRNIFVKILSSKTSLLGINTSKIYIISSKCARKFSTLKIASKPLSTIVSIIAKPWHLYQSRLTTHPITTKCITSGVIYGLGDVIAQKVASPGSVIDKHRVLRGVVYGSVFVAPLAHLHFNFLDWLVVTKLCVRKSFVPFVKVYFDQFLYWAPSIVCIYHISMGTMEGLSFDQVIQRLKAVYWPTLKANWTLWAPMMIINFKFIPVAHQLNFCLMVGMVWASIISYIRGHTPVIIEQRPTPLDTLNIEDFNNLPHCSRLKVNNNSNSMEKTASLHHKVQLHVPRTNTQSETIDSNKDQLSST